MFALKRAQQENARELDNSTTQLASLGSIQLVLLYVLLIAILSLDATRMDLRRDHMLEVMESCWYVLISCISLKDSAILSARRDSMEWDQSAGENVLNI